MIIFFWILIFLMVAWYLGVMGLAYHVFAFRYPRDITLVMLGIFVIVAAPASLIAINYLTQFYGVIY